MIIIKNNKLLKYNIINKCINNIKLQILLINSYNYYIFLIYKIRIYIKLYKYFKMELLLLLDNLIKLYKI